MFLKLSNYIILVYKIKLQTCKHVVVTSMFTASCDKICHLLYDGDVTRNENVEWQQKIGTGNANGGQIIARQNTNTNAKQEHPMGLGNGNGQWEWGTI